MEGRATTYFEFIHHLADPTSFLAYDVTVKIKGNFHLNGDRNQSLQGMEHSLPMEKLLQTSSLPYTCPKEHVAEVHSLVVRIQI